MRKLFIIIALLSATVSIQAQRFEDYFEDRTLRLDYSFAGDNSLHQIYVDELGSLPHWYGRRDRLAELPLKGNGQIAMRSKAPVIPIYIDRKMGFFKVTNLYVGEPIPYDDLLAEGINTETCERMNERMRETFRRMIRETEAEKLK